MMAKASWGVDSAISPACSSFSIPKNKLEGFPVGRRTGTLGKPCGRGAGTNKPRFPSGEEKQKALGKCLEFTVISLPRALEPYIQYRWDVRLDEGHAQHGSGHRTPMTCSIRRHHACWPSPGRRALRSWNSWRSGRDAMELVEYTADAQARDGLVPL